MSQPTPSLSVVLPAPDAYPTLAATVRHLRAQTIAGQLELVLVLPRAAAHHVPLADLEPIFAAVQVVPLDGALGHIGQAYAAGVRAARAPFVTLAEDHSFPQPGWAAALVAAHARGTYAAVGPVIVNANPRTAVSWADALLGYGPWLAPLPGGPVDLLPSHNSCYRRDVLLTHAAPTLEGALAAETVLFWQLRAAGHTLWLAPDAVAAHTNFSRLGSCVGATFHNARVFAAQRARHWGRAKRAAYALAAPLIPLVRLARLWPVARRTGQERPRVLVALAAVLGAGALGEALGYLAGAGASTRLVGRYEFRRIDHVVPAERALWQEDAPPAAVAVPRLVNVGMIGCGKIALRAHLPALRALAGRARVLAVADPVPSRATTAAAMVNAPRTAQDYRDVLAMPDVDAVVVCTPASSHAEVVAAALAAGKHVLVEKPSTLTLDDADALIAARNAARPGLVSMVGFNMRFHALVQRAQADIARGALGTVHALQSRWSLPTQLRGTLRDWQHTRADGGGVLFEIAVHHFDLWRVLLRAEIEEVSAVAHHGATPDETVSITARMSNGVLASALFSERSADANSLDVFGDAGRLHLGGYGLEQYALVPVGAPAGGLGVSVKGMLATARTLPAALKVGRAGGVYTASYIAEWTHFLDAVASGTPTHSTFEDGRAALAATLAVMHAADTARAARPTDAPRRAPAVALEAAPAPAVVAVQGAPLLPSVRMSVVLVTTDVFATLRTTVQHLQRQTVTDQLELIIVTPRDEAALQLDADALAPFAAWQVVVAREVINLSSGYAVGVLAARAPLVVFGEDHSFPEPTWAEALIRAHNDGQGWAAVGPRMKNGNPRTLVSWGYMLLAYGTWADPVASGPAEHLPGHNTCYKRDVLLAYGDSLSDWLQAETALHWDLRAKGHGLYLAADAVTAHHNASLLGVWLAPNYHVSRAFAASRAHTWGRGRRLIYALATPLIPLVRVRRIFAHVARVRPPRMAQVGALIVVGLLVSAFGEAMGYLFGYGDSRTKLGEHELRRVDRVAADERGIFA